MLGPPHPHPRPGTWGSFLLTERVRTHQVPWLSPRPPSSQHRRALTPGRGLYATVPTPTASLLLQTRCGCVDEWGTTLNVRSVLYS